MKGKLQAVLAWLSALVPISAAAAPPMGEERAGTFTAVLENDLFGGRDQNYTNGTKFSYLTPAGAEPAWARQLADFTPPFANDLDVRFEFELGQSMFTPEDLTLATPDPLDRPYAGVLYGSVGMMADADQRVFDQAQLLVGVVGPAALGEESQKAVHHALGAVIPQGWDTQIENRPVFALRYQRAARLVKVDGPLDFDFGPSAGFSLGTWQTYVSTGVNFRLGANLPRDFGPPRIAPSLPGSGYFVPQAQWGWYVFGGLEGRVTAYDVTLDERAANNAKVSRERSIADGQLGFAVHFRDVRVAYTQVLRTREFSEQADPYSEFGALSITLRR